MLERVARLGVSAGKIRQVESPAVLYGPTRNRSPPPLQQPVD